MYNIVFLDLVLDWVLADQVQALLDETDFLHPYQSCLRLGKNHAEEKKHKVTLFIPLYLFVDFSIINYDIFLKSLSEHCTTMVSLLHGQLFPEIARLAID